MESWRAGPTREVLHLDACRPPAPRARTRALAASAVCDYARSPARGAVSHGAPLDIRATCATTSVGRPRALRPRAERRVVVSRRDGNPGQCRKRHEPDGGGTPRAPRARWLAAIEGEPARSTHGSVARSPR